ncbi:hypothetical protein [Lihuaxuella thermophila]|uniref:Uncharacterized protein n=1 Tax=Lihuaxuella thermophila TaxID=1173111 RepID=A0A1H8CX80_9BACL|nr:hypothetical protein [Lihuaxuella thermophila]SEM99054.1 hypothetical protein SAMN05444955_104140 [Lihuaxuella thermophila]
MTTAECKTPVAKKCYYNLLAASYERAERILNEMQRNPEKYSSEMARDTMAYLFHLKKEMRRYGM